MMTLLSIECPLVLLSNRTFDCERANERDYSNDKDLARRDIVRS